MRILLLAYISLCISPVPFSVFAAPLATSDNISIPSARANLTAHFDPDAYPLSADKTLTLTILRPYGPLLPQTSTILALASAQNDIDVKIDVRGDIGLPSYGYRFTENGIQISAQSISRTMTLSKLEETLRGLETMMTDFQNGVGIRSVRWRLSQDGYGIIARGNVKALDTESSPTINGINIEEGAQNNTLTNLTVASTPQALSPDSYPIPNSKGLVLRVIRPYGNPLPKGATTNALVGAQIDLNFLVGLYGGNEEVKYPYYYQYSSIRFFAIPIGDRGGLLTLKKLDHVLRALLTLVTKSSLGYKANVWVLHDGNAAVAAGNVAYGNADGVKVVARSW